MRPHDNDALNLGLCTLFHLGADDLVRLLFIATVLTIGLTIAREGTLRKALALDNKDT